MTAGCSETNDVVWNPTIGICIYFFQFASRRETGRLYLSGECVYRVASLRVVKVRYSVYYLVRLGKVPLCGERETERMSEGHNTLVCVFDPQDLLITA